MAVREIDTSIEDLLEGRGELSRYMWMAKLAWTEPGTSQLTENQVLAPEVEAWKITGRIRDLAVMLDKKEYEDKALKTLLIQCIQELFPLIFAHSREIQMGLKYADFEVQQWVDAYKNLGELDTIKENLRDNITAKDMELLRAIIARMRLINTYLWVFSPEESQQLLPAVKDPFLRTIFQEINNLCSRARWSRGIPANARPW